MTCHDRMAPEDFDLLAGTRTERPAPRRRRRPHQTSGPAPALEEGSAPQLSAPAEPEPEGEAALAHCRGGAEHLYHRRAGGHHPVYRQARCPRADELRPHEGGGLHPMVQTLLTPVTLHPPREEGPPCWPICRCWRSSASKLSKYQTGIKREDVQAGGFGKSGMTVLSVVGPRQRKTALAVALARQLTRRGGVRRLHADLPGHGHRHRRPTGGGRGPHHMIAVADPARWSAARCQAADA